jgi:hypothetical protein
MLGWRTSHTTTMSDDEFDNIPDEFDGIEGIDWTRILAGPANVPTSSNVDLPALPPVRSRSANSSHYSCDDEEMDSAFLAELDALEQNITQTEAGPSRVEGALH